MSKPLSLAAQIALEIGPAEDPLRRRCGTCASIINVAPINVAADGLAIGHLLASLPFE
jgi:hypothetical protein